MATRETDGARWEIRGSFSSRAAALDSRVSRLRRSRARAPLLLNRKKKKPEEKERLLAVYLQSVCSIPPLHNNTSGIILQIF